ncbi:MAG: hypothetical protein ACTSPB_24970 [Candidatus Thorarchaeota archaeon]
MADEEITIKLGGKDYTYPLRVRDGEDKFSTGSKGYSCNGMRIYHEGKQFMVNCNIVELGTKPKD